MKLPRLAAPFLFCRATSIARLLSKVEPHGSRLGLRFNSGLSPLRNTVSRSAKYPERLLIYHAGTGRIVYIGCLRVSTVFVFGFFALVVAPSLYHAPDVPNWQVGAALLVGLMPFLFVNYTTGPFVNYVHLRLPEFARLSQENLMRYSRSLPRNANIDITTMSIIGKPRVSRVDVADIHHIKPRFAVANYARDITNDQGKGLWWMKRPVTQFAILEGKGKAREEGVWDGVVKSITRFSKQNTNN